MHEKPGKLRAAVIGGVVIGVVSGVPGLNMLNCCCCAGVVLGGFLACYLYREEFTPDMSPMESSDALILGVASGVIAAFVGTALDLVITLIWGNVGAEMMLDFVEKLLTALEESGNLLPDAAEQIRRQIDESLEEPLTVFGVLANLFFTLLLYPLFSMLGSLIGFSLSRPKGPVIGDPTAQS